MRSSRDVADLLHGSERFDVMIGAAVSSFGTSHVPDAPTAVRTILFELFRFVHRLDPTFATIDELEHAAGEMSRPRPEQDGRAILPLESVFQALHDAGIRSEHLVDDLCGTARPNDLHVLLSRRAHEGSSRILTTNFDTCIEQAFPDPAAPSRWVAGSGDATLRHQLFKLHGSVDDPDSLRHTLRTVQAGFAGITRQRLREVTSGRLVVLGYAGADNDVMDTVAATGEEVLWLELPGKDTPTAAQTLSATRPVEVVRGNLTDIADVGTYRGSDNVAFRQRLATRFSRLDRERILDAARTLLFDARVNSPLQRDLEDRFHGAFVAHHPDRHQAELYRAARDHDRWSPFHKCRCACRYLRLARRSDPVHAAGLRSDAGDALDGIVLGQAPIIRRFTIRWHLGASVDGPPEQSGWYLFRAARCAWSTSAGRDPLGMLAAAMAGPGMSTWQVANCLRLTALCSAARGDEWRQSLARAEELFTFAGQTQARANLDRSEAICHLLAGDRQASRELLRSSLERHRAAAQATGALQTRLALICLTMLPLSLSQRLVRLM